MTKLLSDYHHTSLYSSNLHLFEKRLGMEVYRPIGMEWFREGYWRINNQEDTATQYLSLDQAWRPSDGTPPLNQFADQRGWGRLPDGVVEIANNEYPDLPHAACSLEYFKNTKFDYLVATIPQHVPAFQELIARYQPQAKLIFQVGNNWDYERLGVPNVLASTMPRDVPDWMRVCFYHQPFDRELFRAPVLTGDEPKRVTSFVNVLRDEPLRHFLKLEKALPEFEFLAYGGQCRDGCVTGSENISQAFASTQFVYHNKPGGDGYGHVLHNAFASGRPVLSFCSQYRGQLGSLLLNKSSVNLDCITVDQQAGLIRYWAEPQRMADLSRRSVAAFDEFVDFDAEADQVRVWFGNLV